MWGSGAGAGHTQSVSSLRAVVYPHCDRVGLSAGSPETAYGHREKPRPTLSGRTKLSFVQCCLHTVPGWSCLHPNGLAGPHASVEVILSMAGKQPGTGEGLNVWSRNLSIRVKRTHEGTEGAHWKV